MEGLRHRPSAADRLADAVVQGIHLVTDASAIEVLHGEPHDRNFLHAAGRLVLIDFEASCRGPVEWDAAFFPDDVAADVWPGVDVGLVQRLRTVISATVSI